jgi:hypothetical protein
MGKTLIRYHQSRVSSQGKLKFNYSVIWKEQVVLIVGAAFSRAQFI